MALMRNLTFLGGGAPIVTPKSYYISSTGNDANSGLTSALPITINKIASLSLNVGDTLLFKKGDMFEFGDFTLYSQYLTIDSYGSGAKPILIGSTSLSAQTWTDEGSGIYSTPLATQPKWIYINGVSGKQAQNTGWFVITGRPSSTIIAATTSSAILNAFSSLVGAKLRTKEFNWAVSQYYTVTAYDSGTNQITVDRAITGSATNYGFFLYDQLQFVTENGEWFWDSVTHKLYVKAAATPAGTDIRVSTKNNAFHLANTRGTVIQNLELTQYYDNAIHTGTCNNATIQFNTIHDIRRNAISTSSSNAGFTLTVGALTIENNTIYNCDLNGVLATGGLSHVIRYNVVHHIGEGASIGFPENAEGGGVGIQSYGNAGTLINQNTVYNIGWLGIVNSYSTSYTTSENVVHDYATKFNDAGGIYTTGIFSSDINNMGTYSKNIVYNGIGNTDDSAGARPINVVGIYIDNYSRNMTLDSNTVYDIPTMGILINWDTKNSTVTNNKVMNCNSMIRIRDASSLLFAVNEGNVVSGNSFVTKSTSQYGIEVESFRNDANYNPYITGGSADNNHYVSPYTTTVAIYRATSGGTLTTYTLATWRTKMGQDVNSTSRTNYIGFTSSVKAAIEVKLETNPTASAVNFNTPVGYSDVQANAFSNPVSIAAWSSLIYLKNTVAP